MQRTPFTGIGSNFHSKFTFKICVNLIDCFEINSVKSWIRAWNFNYGFLTPTWWLKFHIVVLYFCKYRILISVKASILGGLSNYTVMTWVPFQVFFFFFYLGFVSRTFTDHRTAREVGGHPLTPQYHFDPLYRHLGISREITAESSPLHIASSRTRTGNLWFLSASR